MELIEEHIILHSFSGNVNVAKFLKVCVLTVIVHQPQEESHECFPQLPWDRDHLVYSRTDGSACTINDTYGVIIQHW
jgi:hypothetical protein